MTIGYQHQYPTDEPPLSRQCGVLNRAKDLKAKNMKNGASRQHGRVYGSKRGLNGDRSSGGSCSVTTGGRGQTTFGPATLASPRPRRPRTRVNGADIYVVRTTKKGLGNAKPCWRCLEWCRWAGVRRIFYWDASVGDDDDDDGDRLSSSEYSSDSASLDSTDTWEKPKGRWEVVKVNNCRVEDCYITTSDGRLLSGEVGIDSFQPQLPWLATRITDSAVRRFDKIVSLTARMWKYCYDFRAHDSLTLEKHTTNPFATLQNADIPLSYPRVDIAIIVLIRGRTIRHLFRLLL